MMLKWRGEFDFLLFLLFVGLLGFLSPELLNSDVANFNSILTVLVLIYGLVILKNLISWDDLSERLYDSGVYALFIVVSSYFFERVLTALGLSNLYSMYLGGFGYLLAFVLILLASLVYLVRRLSE